MIETYDYRHDGGFSMTTTEPRAMAVLYDCNLIVTYDVLDTTPQRKACIIHGTRPNTTKALRRLLPMMRENLL